MHSKEIYVSIRHLERNEDIQADPQIRRLMEGFEDAISCLIDSPEKRSPTLAYNLQLIVSSLMDVLKNDGNRLRKSQIASIMAIIDFLIS